ncbi:MAG TPA: hypothetical protein VMT64_11805 [Candidatus Binataceae bacterium]|nr:hypothetical protein [Candidatus Binataceae bacterium]
MKNNFKTLSLSLAVVLFAGTNCWSHDFNPEDLSKVQCATTFYSWSETADKPPAETITGIVSDTADQHGKWHSGKLVVHIVNAQGVPEEKGICTYLLQRGDYKISPDGSGVSHNMWKLAEGSDPRCASLHMDWYAKGGVDPALKTRDPGEATENFYLNGPNSGYQMAIGPAGFATGTCKPTQ